MAHVVGTGLDAVKAFFSKNYAQLDFFQMARLLSHALQQEGRAQGLEVSPEEWESRLAAVLRVRPTLSLAFPEHDLAHIETRRDGKIQVEAGFFGLYGVTSPLPYFYTEGLMQASQQGRTSARGLLDIFHYAAYPLLIKAWTRHRNLTGLQEGLTERQLTRQTSWVGLVGHASRKRFDQWPRIVHLAPLLSTIHRSASGLQALVNCVVRSGATKVQPCVPTRMRVPAQARLCLGRVSHQLGSQAVLGDTLIDRRNNVSIVLQGQADADVEAVVPGGKLYPLLTQSLQLFALDNLRIRFKVERQPTPKPLGMAKLGLGACLGHAGHTGSFSYFVN
jgi:type VI secretion system protein ImpH